MFSNDDRFHLFTEKYLTEKINSNKPYIAVIGLDNFYSSECMSIEDTIEFISCHNYELIFLDANKGLGSIIRMVFKKV